LRQLGNEVAELGSIDIQWFGNEHCFRWKNKRIFRNAYRGM